ncbi:MAG: hypothetical protein EXR88_05490 [Gammaproteobacteria bacterium]|nr:hypothetical protein [Gammaproteobacteria bacterium]
MVNLLTASGLASGLATDFLGVALEADIAVGFNFTLGLVLIVDFANNLVGVFCICTGFRAFAAVRIFDFVALPTVFFIGIRRSL